LRTAQAKQCFVCGADWHDPEHLVKPSAPPNSSQELGLRYMRAFANRDYAACLQQFPAFFQTEAAVFALPWKIFLISAQRLGQPEVAERFGQELLSRNEMAARVTVMLGQYLAWESELVKLTLGHVEPAQVLAQAADDHQRCQAHYYAGARHLTLGNQEAALAEFDACLALHVDCVERGLAEVERRHVVGGEADATPGVQAEAEAAYREMEERGHRLHQQGRHEECFEVARQMVDLAREKFGPRHGQYALSLKNLALYCHGLKRYDEAERHLLECARIVEEVVGRADPLYIDTLRYLARFAEDRRDAPAESEAT
jgi:tetratricopeptide (TPR) repeat protein